MPAPSNDLIVLTGFPGYMAWRLSALLLRDRPEAEIVALAHPRDADRVATAARELGRSAPGAHSHFRWYPCEPALPGGGLDPALVAPVTGATEFFHLAGVGSPCEPNGDAGTAALLALAARCTGLRRFNYLS